MSSLADKHKAIDLLVSTENDEEEFSTIFKLLVSKRMDQFTCIQDRADLRNNLVSFVDRIYHGY